MRKSRQPISEVGDKPPRSPLGKVIMGVRLLEAVALFGFAVLAFLGWSYHGRSRPWEIDAGAVILGTFCGVIELGFWVARKIKRPPD